MKKIERNLGFFERYLTMWVFLCIGAGILLGKFLPHLVRTLDSMAISINNAPVISIPIAVCLFFMMYPIMVKIDFNRIVQAGRSPKPIGLTLFINWAIKPFTMLGISYVFLGIFFYYFIGADAVDFVTSVGMQNVRVLLDTFHLIREEDNIYDAIVDSGHHLGYFHANENHRGVPGRGLVPWAEVFKALKDIHYDGCLTIESFDPNNENLVRMGSMWRKLSDSPEQLAREGLAFLRDMYNKIIAS